jgi:hypothetical protein
MRHTIRAGNRPGRSDVSDDEQERRARLAANEAVYRAVNEQIEELNRTLLASVAEKSLPMVCECANMNCAEPLSVEPKTYEHVRSDPTWFLVRSGHEVPDVEVIVETHDGFNVVCKNKAPGKQVAQQTDPRK